MMNNYKDLQKYYPTLVSNIAGKKTENESIERMERLNILPIKIKEILYSDEIVEFIYGVEQRYHLKDLQTEEISRTIRQYFFREVTEGLFAKKVAEICHISPDESLKLLKAINAIIPGQKQDIQELQKIKKMPLKTAISKYPQILQQQITEKSIISKPFLKPLKPTVKNWIMVYEKVLDVSRHSMIERGEFVYRAEATRGLTEVERKNLSTLFKSRDEESNLMIDENQNKIIFHIPQKKEENITEVKTPQIKKQTIPAPSKTISQNISQQKPPINQMDDVQKERKKTFDFITPIKSVSTEQTDDQEKDIKIEEKEKKQEKKGFFGTETFLPKKEDEVVNDIAVGSEFIQKVEEEKKWGNSIENIVVEQKKPIQKEQILQDTTGEIEFFAKNIVQRPQINDQNIHSTKNGEKRVVGSADFGVHDAEMDDEVMQQNKQRNLENIITKEKEELQKATQKVETLINSMQDSVQIPRDIGEPVRKKGQYKPREEGGNLKEEIKKNQKDLYGITFSEEKDDFDVEIVRKKPVKDANSLEGEIVFENNAGSKVKDEGDINMLKKENSVEEIVFSSNHTFPSEKEGEKKKDSVKNLFSISPMGQSHAQKNQKQKNKKNTE